MASPDADETWLLDSITGFLRGPAWALPVMSFIDENCIIFDGDAEHKFAYTAIYEAFKELVDSLLEAHLQDIGVSNEQFAAVVERMMHTRAGKETLQQILAVDDPNSFNKMMSQRNRELELEAIRALETLSSSAKAPPEEAAEEQPEGGDLPLSEEEAQLQLALKESMVEAGLAVERAEVEAKRREKEEADLQMAIALSLQLEEERERAGGGAGPSGAPPETSVAHETDASPQQSAQRLAAEEATRRKAPEPEPAAVEVPPAPEVKAAPEAETAPKPRAAEDPAALEARMARAAQSIAASEARSDAILPLKRVEAAHAAAEAAAPRPPKAAFGAAGFSSLAGLPALRGGSSTAPSVHAVQAGEALAKAAEVRVRAEEEMEERRKATAAKGGDTAIAQAQMEARAAHLRKQRDLIVAQRKKDRENQAEHAAAAKPALAVAPSPASIGAQQLDDRRADLSRALAAGMKSQLTPEDAFGLPAECLEERRVSFESTKARLKAEFGGRAV